MPDAVDNCPGAANPGQEDLDGDSIGDACDPDDDGDAVLDAVDNCAGAANPTQAESDGDGAGDACDAPATPAADDVATLTQAANQLPLAGGEKQSLLASLAATAAAIEEGNVQAACGSIGAFENKVAALVRSRRISSSQASTLAATIAALRAKLGW